MTGRFLRVARHPTKGARAKFKSGNLLVTYATQDTARHDEVPGTGNEFVDVCDVNGTFISRFASRGVRN